jgi:hypothetical protein
VVVHSGDGARRLVPMPTSSKTSVLTLEGRYEPGAFFDEMFEAPGRPRPHYRVLAEQLAALSVEEFEERRHGVDVSFLNRASASPSTARRRGSSGSSPST